MNSLADFSQSYPDSGTRYSVINIRNNNSMDSDSMVSNSGYEDMALEPPKKKRVRARLDHLTPNEKLQRRKMKNRIAAQTARDRKRAKIDQLEAENRRLREENAKLRVKMDQTIQLQQNHAPCLPPIVVSSQSVDDSGVSDLESHLRMSASSSGDSAEMDLLGLPQGNQSHSSSHDGLSVGDTSPRSEINGLLGISSASEDCSSPIPTECIDSLVGDIDEKAMLDDVLKLQQSIFDGSDNDKSLESAELISAPQQQVQEMSFQSQLVENSAGWTSIQLMLLLMISRIHRLYSLKTGCCATTHDSNNVCQSRDRTHENLYDYLLETKCTNLRRAIDAIMYHKHDIRKQKIVALEFMYIYLYRSGKLPHKRRTQMRVA